jgi:phage FluMu gp28-like protein
MTTAERVARFGKTPIVLTYEGMAEVDFQREYEAIYADEDIAWIGWNEIKDLQDPNLKCFSITIKGKNIGPARQLIDQFVAQMKKLEPTFCGGVDIGRDKNTTEIFLVGRSSTKHYPLRLTITLDDCPFDEQTDVLVYLLTKVPISKLFIDRNGIGRQISESLEKRFPSKAEGVDFTNASKALWAGDAKMLAQQKKAPLPVDRDLAYQIHSIKRKVSAARNMIFDSDTNEKHHADKFWAWALALNAAIGRTENEVKARFIAYN